MKTKKEIEEMIVHLTNAIDGLDCTLANGINLDFFHDSRVFNELEASREALYWVLDDKDFKPYNKK